jgi:hypothetical protein
LINDYVAFHHDIRQMEYHHVFQMKFLQLSDFVLNIQKSIDRIKQINDELLLERLLLLMGIIKVFLHFQQLNVLYFHQHNLIKLFDLEIKMLNDELQSKINKYFVQKFF